MQPRPGKLLSLSRLGKRGEYLALEGIYEKRGSSALPLGVEEGKEQEGMIEGRFPEKQIFYFILPHLFMSSCRVSYRARLAQMEKHTPLGEGNTELSFSRRTK